MQKILPEIPLSFALKAKLTLQRSAMFFARSAVVVLLYNIILQLFFRIVNMQFSIVQYNK